jgi:hypothetical protein
MKYSGEKTMASKLTEFFSKVEKLTSEGDNIFLASGERKLQKLGVPKAVHPEMDLPKFPPDITALSDTELGKLYGVYSQWKGYVDYLIKLKEADERFFKNAGVIAKRMILNQSDLTNLKPTEVKSVAERSEVVISIDLAYTQAEVERLSAESRYVYIDSCVTALSREISRRDAHLRRAGFNS